jgi:hypothetical protein
VPVIPISEDVNNIRAAENVVRLLVGVRLVVSVPGVLGIVITVPAKATAEQKRITKEVKINLILLKGNKGKCDFIR